MSNVDPDIYSLSYSQVWSGFKSLLPISSFVVIFGAAFGLAATQTGLDNSSIML
ncbi:MAG: branched-chain amino acid ABC transporter permease, partial [Acinetobacter sp.]|nr:branched-chain amino acid ABC transporter permease [Acinetobacter sp.]